MRISVKNILYFFFFLILGCVEPYAPPELAGYEQILVIKGILNADSGEGEVVISKTQPLNGTGMLEYVNDAEVILKSSNGENYRLSATENKYKVTGLQTAPNMQYILQVKDNTGNVYESSPVVIKSTPEIDSISWKVKNNGIQIYVNTHDPTDNTWYYKWNYEETYEFTSGFESLFVYDEENDTVIERNENIFRCWRTNPSKEIIVGTSNSLKKDIISEFPLLQIDGEDTRLRIKYSILVHQYALSKEAYDFWSLLEKNSENVGSIFDPQPAIIEGNIVCKSNPNLPVIGYFEAASVKSKRIFIRSNEVNLWRQKSGYEYCMLDTLEVKDFKEKGPYYEFVIPIYGFFGVLEGFMVTSTGCVDCRLRGTNKRPVFWE